jgi:protein transport protein SEC24
VELGSIDADKSIGFVVKNDDKLKENSFGFIQFAMLYTTLFGERRIRVFNMNMQLAKNLNAYFKGADVETLSSFIIKREASRVMTKGAKVTKE